MILNIFDELKLAWLLQYTVIGRDVELLRLLSNMVNQIISFTEFERAIIKLGGGCRIGCASSNVYTYLVSILFSII